MIVHEILGPRVIGPVEYFSHLGLDKDFLSSLFAACWPAAIIYVVFCYSAKLLANLGVVSQKGLANFAVHVRKINTPPV